MLPIRRTRFFGRGSSSNDDANRSRVRPTRPATVRATRVDANRPNLPSFASFPEALPSDNVTDLYPELRCPLANVVLTDPCELQPWLSVARPVTKEFAESVGGCIVLLPSASSCSPDSPESSSDATRYYCVAWCDDTVYGRASYLPSPSATCAAHKECTNETTDSGHCHCVCCIARNVAAASLKCRNEGSLGCCSAVCCSSDLQLKPCPSTSSE